MTDALEQLADGSAIVYVAGRLFDIGEKLKSELLDAAVSTGIQYAAEQRGLPGLTGATFVPFRDAGQEDMVIADKTHRLFRLDIERLNRTVLLVSYIDGMAKDEGVCFEVGYCHGRGVKTLLISTDFFDIELPDGHSMPVDPLLHAGTSRLIRWPRLATSASSFGDSLRRTQAAIHREVERTVAQLLLEPGEASRRARRALSPTHGLDVFVDFGGGLYEWQTMLCARLEAALADASRVHLHFGSRFIAATDHMTTQDRIGDDLERATGCDLLVTCVDGDEAPSGTAFLQGVMTARGRPVWMYNSKRTHMTAEGGYRSSRNLMLDYSASRVFETIDELAYGLRVL